MAIIFQEENQLFHIEMSTTSYIFGLNPSGYLQHIYWGKTIVAEDCKHYLQSILHSSFDMDINRENEEYSFWTGGSYIEPCLKVSFANGNRRLQMKFKSWEQTVKNEIEILKIYLEDEQEKLETCLYYVVDPTNDVLTRYATFTNKGKDNITIEHMKSAAFHIPQLKKQQLTYAVGKWAGEYQLKKVQLDVGKFTMESKRGITGPHFNPILAIDDGYATETMGEVWFGMLGWSGNWKIDIEKTIFNHTYFIAGINDFDCEIQLKPNQMIKTPECLGGHSSQGYGEMSRKLHKHQRECIIPRKDERKVLYNSWEATTFAVQANEQKKLAKKAADIGVELFVVDDGWFSTRDSDQSGLGDWRVSKEKFPEGLGNLIQYVNELGMDFGIWVEPEAVNPDSELFRSHPDWIYHFEGIEPVQARNQYVLNLGKEEVKQYVLTFMTELLSKYPIRFIKWDMNRAISDPSIGESITAHKQLWYDHINALYDIWGTIRTRFPYLEMETCCGGGGRIDLGILRYADECWPSDNTDPYDRLMIQEGFTYFYPSKMMMCWVTDTPNHVNKRITSLKYRFHSAMTGSLGIGGNISKWTDDELDEAQMHIKQYKQIRHIVQNGELYRLESPTNSNVGAVQYINERESVIFVFLHAQNFMSFMPRIRLQGLKLEKCYAIDDRVMSGRTLMNFGIEVKLKGDFDSQLIYIREM